MFSCKFCEVCNNAFSIKHLKTHAKILWTHAKISTHATHAKILQTYATHVTHVMHKPTQPT